MSAPLFTAQLRRPHSPEEHNEYNDFINDPSVRTVLTPRRKLLRSNLPLSAVNIDQCDRFAQSRYPFPPFSIHFETSAVSDKQVVEDLVKYFKISHKIDLDIASCRLSTNNCQHDECNMLVFVKTSDSFAEFYGDGVWSDQLCGHNITVLAKPSIPPQLCVILINVPYKLDINILEQDIKRDYPEVKTAVRLKNKDQFGTKLVKVVFKSAKTRDDVLRRGIMVINYLQYDCQEYLGQAHVLICSKCRGIGHFNKQCKQIETTCKVCGEKSLDIKQHRCSDINKCIHCGGEHRPNDPRCKVVKEYRADLTKKLLQHSENVHNSRVSLCASQFPSLGVAQRPVVPNTDSGKGWEMMPKVTDNTRMDTKLDEINNRLVMIMSTCDTMMMRNVELEKYMKEKEAKEEQLFRDVASVQTDVKIHSMELKHRLVPVVLDICKFIKTLNYDKMGRTLDAEFMTSVDKGIAILSKYCKNESLFSSNLV
ncbi:unnamed protein product [Didymodactylos carnosus]|uniref:CCHC-type domain-containing protein n=1 Tax=Didymodactylos carnosus TaxID=1234261 RepID=A0A8S2FLF7_9BILA|nr:unnamed protein product [Didymodactylos carnosus]CAF4292922.1 unnamed protein product [Didymodactylos carnosus]